MVIGTIAAIAAVLSVILCLCTGGFGSLVWLWLLISLLRKMPYFGKRIT